MHDVNVHDLQIYNFITSNYSSKKEKANTEKQLLGGGGGRTKKGKMGTEEGSSSLIFKQPEMFCHQNN